MQKSCDCGWSGSKIALHWHHNPEHRPSLSNRQKEILTGLLMGDAWMNPNGYMAIDMIKEEFLEWVNKEMGVFGCGVRLDETAEKNAERNRDAGMVVNEENYNDVYRLRTITHPEIKSFLDWYQTGEKVFPDDVDLSPLLVNVWYCCDGVLYEMDNGYWDVRISAYNETERLQSLATKFNDVGMHPKAYGGVLVFGASERDKFFDFVGDALPGFKYKWK